MPEALKFDIWHTANGGVTSKIQLSGSTVLRFEQQTWSNPSKSSALLRAM